MFRISHLDRKTDVEVLKMAKAKQTLLRTIQERKLQYLTFDTRKGKTKTTDGRKDRRVKMQRTWTRDMTDWCGLSYTKCVRRAENRNNGVPWQPIFFFFEVGTHSDSDPIINLTTNPPLLENVDKETLHKVLKYLIT